MTVKWGAWFTLTKMTGTGERVKKIYNYSKKKLKEAIKQIFQVIFYSNFMLFVIYGCPLQNREGYSDGTDWVGTGN